MNNLNDIDTLIKDINQDPEIKTQIVGTGGGLGEIFSYRGV